MKKVMISLILSLLLVFAVSCNNPNKSTTDKVGGYHVSAVPMVLA